MCRLRSNASENLREIYADTLSILGFHFKFRFAKTIFVIKKCCFCPQRGKRGTFGPIIQTIPDINVETPPTQTQHCDSLFSRRHPILFFFFLIKHLISALGIFIYSGYKHVSPQKYRKFVEF